MREVVTIAQAFKDAAETLSVIAKVEFFTNFTMADLDMVKRTPLLLISPHMMYLANGRDRQYGTQLLLNTFLISRQQRLERDEIAALEYIGVLDALDAAVVNNNFDLDIQPFDIYQRKAIEVKKGISVIRTIYSTVIYGNLASSKFVYVDETNISVTFEFTLAASSHQIEHIKDTNDYDRTLNGTFKSYSRAPKRRYEITWTLIPLALKEQLRVLKSMGKELTFFRDKDGDATMTCLWTNDFNFFEERPGFWSGSIILQES
jgi:hypothetical protein